MTEKTESNDSNDEPAKNAADKPVSSFWNTAIWFEKLRFLGPVSQIIMVIVVAGGYLYSVYPTFKIKNLEEKVAEAEHELDELSAERDSLLDETEELYLDVLLNELNYAVNRNIDQLVQSYLFSRHEWNADTLRNVQIEPINLDEKLITVMDSLVENQMLEERSIAHIPRVKEAMVQRKDNLQCEFGNEQLLLLAERFEEDMNQISKSYPMSDQETEVVGFDRMYAERNIRDDIYRRYESLLRADIGACYFKQRLFIWSLGSKSPLRRE